MDNQCNNRFHEQNIPSILILFGNPFTQLVSKFVKTKSFKIPKDILCVVYDNVSRESWNLFDEKYLNFIPRYGFLLTDGEIFTLQPFYSKLFIRKNVPVKLDLVWKEETNVYNTSTTINIPFNRLRKTFHQSYMPIQGINTFNFPNWRM
jgi:hypothetical protein